MITSMTGFGSGEASGHGISVKVEARSLNSRFLEIVSNLPKKLYFKEFELREIVKSKLSRGKINITIAVEYSPEAAVSPVKANLDLAEAYYHQLQEIRKRLKIKDAIKLEDILRYTDIFKSNDDTEANEQEWKLIAKALHTALDKLNQMRQQEGRELSRDLHNRIKNIERTVAKIEQMAQERIPQERQRLREKIARIFESDELDMQRLEMEIVLLADKYDISEECIRMQSHIKFAYEALKGKEQAGRTINFLLQEMNREANTMGAKANDAALTQLVVAVKEDIERLREQIQNVE
ncbi:MAG: YicC/YloC family endoribonuclease [Bacteroidota bacterium]|nr:YicC family protein [Candidatus Kapabacteria bacterium]MDW8219252.1 YicC/YloC family endoribonuclease [Bacteroidota bacterium]